jgi:hypothetical protein
MLETIINGIYVEVNTQMDRRSSTFTPNEIGTIASKMGNEFSLRMSPHGNPILTHRETSGNNVIYVLYKHKDGIIIRRRLGYANPCGSGHVLNGNKPFTDVNKAMDYFVSYKKKYPNAIIG